MNFSSGSANEQDETSHKSFRELADGAPSIVWITDRNGTCTFISRKWTEITGQSQESALGYGWLERVHPDDCPRVKVLFNKAKAQARVLMVEYRLLTAKGEYRWVRDSASPQIDSNGHYQGYIGGVEDIHDIKMAAEALYISNRRFQAAIEAVEGLIWIADKDGNFVGEQPEWARLTGQAFDEYQGYGWSEAIHPDSRKQFFEAVDTALKNGASLEAEQVLKTASGEWRTFLVSAHPVRNPDGTVHEWVGIHTDITDKKLHEQKVLYIATHDALTHLPNRLLLDDRLNNLVQQRSEAVHAVLFVDLNRFKLINDSLGHQIGDQLLVEIANRLSHHLRSGDTIARFGGDEFVIVLQFIANENDAAHAAVKILDLIAEPMLIGDHELSVNASIGIAMFPKDGTDTGTLLRHADRAMYSAKRLRGNGFRFYEKTVNESWKQRLILENDLRRAIALDQLYLHFQPKILVSEHKVASVEALVRWKHPTRGLINPNEFISVAEEVGLINEIGLWILRASCQQLDRLQSQGYPDIGMAVNISVVQLDDPKFLGNLNEVLTEVKINPRLLELELTESKLMENIQSHEILLSEIEKLGVKLAIDDFGTGYSSLSYLRKLPIKTLKIDKSFVDDIVGDSDAAVIVSATISMAKEMGLNIVAEGVETSEQAESLREKGCNCMQGYYFSTPLPPEQLPAFITDFQGKR
jgi:diguanylate cyclase (GGDEF)-like protein/PAS domain S-box-containing protein